jgi:hypothetical protein
LFNETAKENANFIAGLEQQLLEGYKLKKNWK